MKRIKIGLWAFIFGISALWFLADSLLPQPFNYFSFRYVFNQYSGVLAMGAMSLCMLLSIRAKWLENVLQGLDKGYRLHKWLGITALVSALAHFWFTKGTKWMVGWGWLTRPERRRPQGTQQAVQTLEQWLGSMRGVAESVGEWAFYVAAVLMMMALIKAIPYHWFVKLHKWLALAYLALVFHAVVLLKFEYWTQPIGWVMVILLMGGVVSALWVLLKRHGAAQRSTGTVQVIQTYPHIQSMALEIHAPAWAGHQAGQFAFLRNPHDYESAHPFTIASAWQAHTQQLRFLIKDLGDYTHRLTEHFKVGEQVILEGPYGRFDFRDDAQAQVWVAGGIGITPFMARLEELAQAGGSTLPIHLFYSYRNDDPVLRETLQQHAQAAKVVLHLWSSQENGRLNSEHIRAVINEGQPTSVWFCGDATFGRCLQKELSAYVPAHRFHQELFEMR